MSSTIDLGHGSRLTDDEYERAVVALQERQPELPMPDEDRAARREALRLVVHHRLGKNFPAERFERTWEVSERLQGRHLRLTAWALFRRLVHRAPDFIHRRLGQTVVTEYAKVLTDDELTSFLGAESAEFRSGGS